MKTITIIAEQLTDRALAATLPAKGVVSVTISDQQSPAPKPAESQGFRGFRNPARFRPTVRMDLLVEDDAVETVFDSLSFAYGAGVLSDAAAWVGEAATALAA